MRYFPDILPEGVLRHYGYTERPSGTIGESALYSLRDEAKHSEKRKSIDNYTEEQYNNFGWINYNKVVSFD